MGNCLTRSNEVDRLREENRRIKENNSILRENYNDLLSKKTEQSSRLIEHDNLYYQYPDCS